MHKTACLTIGSVTLSGRWRDTADTAAGLKHSETRRSIGDTSVPHTLIMLGTVQVNRKRWGVCVCACGVAGVGHFS